MFYEFSCKEHGRFEVSQGINDEHVALCPACDTPAKRVFSAPTISGDLPTLLRGKAIESKAIMAMGG